MSPKPAKSPPRAAKAIKPQANLHQSRLRALQSVLQKRCQQSGASRSILLLSSGNPVIKSYDLKYPFRQDSSFFYLTGHSQPNLTLVVRSDQEPLLLGQRLSRREIYFEGSAPPLKQIGDYLGVESRYVSNWDSELFGLVKGYHTFYFQTAPASAGFKVAQRLLATPLAELRGVPRELVIAESVIEPLRSIKSPEEIATIMQAIKLTIESLLKNLRLLKAGGSEAEFTTALNNQILATQAEVAFDTIVASGPSAAILHYIQQKRAFRKGEPVLVDWGAYYNGYAGDLTRVFPIGRPLGEPYRTIYQIVLEAQRAAIAKVAPGVKISQLYQAATRCIVEGLKELRLLKGSVDSLLFQKAYLPYFPHGIGHGLGIDVHDPLANSPYQGEPVLEPNMVITIEPGLYFPKKAGIVPRGGIRIEDNVQVTKQGAKILSSAMPKELSEIEALLGF